ncbi:acid protease [Mycena pura]|uniref:Acid protease n=1 Tax=Mycena pura TaxID=153505 RepID=A0AAD6YKG4_9AGAR|nr:acid protease [Mycena pura]
MHPSALLAVLLALFSFSVDARPTKARRSGLLTLPLRHVQRNNGVHVELRHQQQINRATRLAARADGLVGPSDEQLRANLERRAAYLSKRYNVPTEGSGSSTTEPDTDIATLTVEDDETSPALAPFSSVVSIDGADTSYVATVGMGTPSRDFAIILDSGSGDFWVQSDDECTSDNGGGCGNHSFLGAASSSTFVNTKKPWSITYGSGSAAGEIVNDTIVLGGVLLDNHTFGIAHEISSSFSRDAVADGLMGLGKAGLSNQGVPTPVQVLRNRGVIPAAITSYRLPRLLDHTNNGEVTFGGVDETKFDPSTAVTIDSTSNGFWLTALGGVSVNGGDVSINSTVALMDTGTSLLIAPAADAAAIHAKIPGAILQDSGSYTIPCDTTASVSLKFGGKQFEINPKDLLFASSGRTTGACTSGIGSFDDTKFLVGDTFLKNVYFSTNADDNTIMLAKAI